VDASIRFAETPLAGLSILQYAPESPGAKAYRALARIVMAQGAETPAPEEEAVPARPKARAGRP
jgi:nitrogenase subunit NifH